MNRLNTAIQNREIVRIGARAGHAVGLVGIALGYNAQYDSVKIGFVDENGRYTGESTRIGANHVEYIEPKTAETANQYTVELSPEIASRFLMIAGVGLPARRATCLLELQQHVLKSFGTGAPKRAEQTNKVLYGLVWDWYHCADATGQPVRRFAGADRC